MPLGEGQQVDHEVDEVDRDADDDQVPVHGPRKSGEGQRVRVVVFFFEEGHLRFSDTENGLNHEQNALDDQFCDSVIMKVVFILEQFFFEKCVQNLEAHASERYKNQSRINQKFGGRRIGRERISSD